jgi:hypothetical protein
VGGSIGCKLQLLLQLGQPPLLVRYPPVGFFELLALPDPGFLRGGRGFVWLLHRAGVPRPVGGYVNPRQARFDVNREPEVVLDQTP